MKKRVAAIVTAASMLVLTACGGGQAAGNAQVPGNQQETEEGAGGERSEKDSLVISINSEPTTLDPAMAGDTVSFIPLTQIFEPLVREDKEKLGEVVPGLASSWEFSDDMTEVTFEIRDGVKFHNGDEVTVEDVEFSLTRALESTHTTAFSGAMDHWETVDDHHVKLVMKYPYAPVLGYISTPCFGIVSKRAVEEAQASGTDFGRNPVGSGPFRFVTWNTGEKIVLERFDEYFNGPSIIRDLTWRVMTDSSTSTIALEQGEVDVVYSMSDTDKVHLRDNPDIQFITGSGIGVHHITFNCGRPPFDNPKVREAVSYIIDRETMIIGACDGNAEPASTIFAPCITGYPGEIEVNPYDPEKAKALLAEAGYPDGFSCVIKDMQNNIYIKPSEILQDELRKIGIIAEIVPMERGAYFAEVGDSFDYDITVNMTNANVMDADYIATKRLHSAELGNANNMTNYVNPELDALIEKARVSGDVEERKQIYGQISEIVREECPMIPLYVRSSTFPLRAELGGFYFHPTFRFNLQDAYWKE